MMVENVSRRYLGVLGFAVFLLAPSFDTALKYLGTKGLVLYFVIGTCIILLGHRFVMPVFRNLISERHATYFAIITFLLLIGIALYGYPIANSGRFGVGSDADEALLTAAGELIRGRYPYYLQTYLGNQISPLPGAVLFAVPFVILGAISLQNVFWLAVLFIAVRYFEKSSVLALGLIWVTLGFSPTVLQNIVTGADYISNSIYILVLMWILIKMVSDSTASQWKRLVPSVLLGLAFSSRSNFLLLLPLLLSILVQTSGWKSAIKYSAISGLAFLLVTVPFWLYDPPGFAPLIVQAKKLRAIEEVLPFAGVIIPGSAVMLSMILSFQKLKSDCILFFRNCAIVQLFVLFFTSAVYSIKLGQPDLYLGQSGYGMFTLFFGALAGWLNIYGRDINDPTSEDRLV
ncbi:MAG: hypothetical protein ABIP78_00865 [Pyrinomonadaceae bacterium]